MADTSYDGVTVADYAAHLATAVHLDYCDEPTRYGACANWSDLHEVCDANDYLQDADEAFGVVVPDGVAFDNYVRFTNAAIALVEADWPIPTDGASWTTVFRLVHHGRSRAVEAWRSVLGTTVSA